MIKTYEQLHAALLAWHETTDNFYCEEIVLEIYAGDSDFEYGLRYDGASSHALEELEPMYISLPISQDEFTELVESFADMVDDVENKKEEEGSD